METCLRSKLPQWNPNFRKYNWNESCISFLRHRAPFPFIKRLGGWGRKSYFAVCRLMKKQTQQSSNLAKNVAQKGFIQIQMQTHTRRRETFDPSTFEIIHIMDFNTLILSTMSIERHLFCFTLFCFFQGWFSWEHACIRYSQGNQTFW